jgi:hypothetical protein
MVYDVITEYKKKSYKELLAIKKQFVDAVEKHPQVKMFNEHLSLVSMLIAERVGAKKCTK